MGDSPGFKYHGEGSFLATAEEENEDVNEKEATPLTRVGKTEVLDTLVREGHLAYFSDLANMIYLGELAGKDRSVI